MVDSDDPVTLYTSIPAEALTVGRAVDMLHAWATRFPMPQDVPIAAPPPRLLKQAPSTQSPTFHAAAFLNSRKPRREGSTRPGTPAVASSSSPLVAPVAIHPSRVHADEYGRGDGRPSTSPAAPAHRSGQRALKADLEGLPHPALPHSSRSLPVLKGSGARRGSPALATASGASPVLAASARRGLPHGSTRPVASSATAPGSATPGRSIGDHMLVARPHPSQHPASHLHPAPGPAALDLLLHQPTSQPFERTVDESLASLRDGFQSRLNRVSLYATGTTGSDLGASGAGSTGTVASIGWPDSGQGHQAPASPSPMMAALLAGGTARSASVTRARPRSGPTASRSNGALPAARRPHQQGQPLARSRSRSRSRSPGGSALPSGGRAVGGAPGWGSGGRSASPGVMSPVVPRQRASPQPSGHSPRDTAGDSVPKPLDEDRNMALKAAAARIDDVRVKSCMQG